VVADVKNHGSLAGILAESTAQARVLVALMSALARLALSLAAVGGRARPSARQGGLAQLRSSAQAAC
jgi:hypothetical protein